MIEALIVLFWIPVFTGMTLFCREATQGRQDGWTLFVIPDQMLLCEVSLRYEARVGNPEKLPRLAA